MLDLIKTNPIELNQRLIADIGGTYARFALLNENGSIQNDVILNAEDFPDFVGAYKAYLQQINNPIITEAAIAIANPINGDNIKMTNHNWAFSIEEVRQNLQLERLIFKNDFAALALSIPFLKRSECYQVGGGEAKLESPIGVLGPGTGLGVSGLIYSGEKWLPISGEGGHVSLSPTTKKECQILDFCWQQYQHVSAERLISGSGLKKILEALCSIKGVKAKPELSPKDISKMAMNQTDELCVEALDIFCGLLGTVAGNLALTLGAKGGVYIGGGIIPKLGGFFENSSFREKFEAKGRFNDYLKEIPVFVIQSKHPALLGISRAFE